MVGRRYIGTGQTSSGYLLTDEGFEFAAGLPPLVVSNIGWFHREVINRDNYRDGEQSTRSYAWEANNKFAKVYAEIEEQNA